MNKTTDSSPLISVIIPVYNAEKYLSNCISSLLSQSLQSFEIILVDDGSKDSSPLLCDEFAKKDPRIRSIHLENGGPAYARNHGSLQAQGDYIAFVDSDDYVAPNYLELLYNCAVGNNSDIVMCGYYIVSGANKQPALLSYCAEYGNAEAVKVGLLQRYYGTNHNGLYSLWNKLYRAEFLRENRITMNEELNRAEDAWFNFDCLTCAERVNFINQPLYYYVQHSESIMHQLRSDQYAAWVQTRQRLLEANKTLGFCIDNNLFYQEFLYKVAIYIRDYIAAGKIEEANAILNDTFLHMAAKYRKNLPLHIRFLHSLTYHHLAGIALIFYKIWERISSCKTAKR